MQKYGKTTFNDRKKSKGHCFLLNNTDSGKYILFHFSLVTWCISSSFWKVLFVYIKSSSIYMHTHLSSSLEQHCVIW